MAYSQEELINIVRELIIDNNTNQVTPAKVRNVFEAVISAMNPENAGSVSASDPLVYDPFTNSFSIPKADATKDGFLSKEDFIIFSEGGGEDPGLQEVLDVSGEAEDVSILLKSSTQPSETHFTNEEIKAVNGNSIVKMLTSGISIENANEIIQYLSNALLYTDKSTGYQSKLWMLRAAAGFAEFHTDPNKPAGVYIFVTRDELASKANLVAGKVPSNELPSYVDDIIEGYLLSNVFYLESGHTTVIPAETGKIYIDITTGQKNKEYRYSGSTYIQITNGLIASADDVPDGASNKYASTSNVKSALGITTLSGSNTGDETTATLKTKIDVELSFALSDETSNLTVGNLISFRMPYAMTLSSVRISVNDAPTVSTVIVDVKESGVSIFSTLVSIDAGELTSVTAAVPAVISDTSLADDALITVSTTQIGSGNPGKGLKMTLKGKKT